jgi:hypothetical protein
MSYRFREFGGKTLRLTSMLFEADVGYDAGNITAYLLTNQREILDALLQWSNVLCSSEWCDTLSISLGRSIALALA